jgi:hypothetical protein
MKNYVRLAGHFASFFGVLNHRNLFCNNALLLLVRPVKKLVFPDIIPADESHPNHASPRKGSFRFPGDLRIRSLRLLGDLRSFSPVPNEQMVKK